MMRDIKVSTGVFAGIWAKRQAGENSEDQILRRILGVPDEDHRSPSIDQNGVEYPEFGVRFEEGDEIFRDYGARGAPKVRYSAVATGGGFRLRNDGRFYPSLHKLSEAVVGGRENSWMNWKIERGGQAIVIDRLRKTR